MKLIDSSEARIAENRPSAEPPRYMVIDTAWKKRWVGTIGYLIFFAVVAVLLMWIFARFTNSWPLAVLLVTCMAAYMVIMGYAASKRIQHTDDANLQ